MSQLIWSPHQPELESLNCAPRAGRGLGLRSSCFLLALLHEQYELEAVVRLVSGAEAAPSSVKKILAKADKNNDGMITFGTSRSASSFASRPGVACWLGFPLSTLELSL